MAYLPDPTDASQPVAQVKASTAAAEFRALKAYIAALAGLTPITALPALTIPQLNGGQIAGMRNRVYNSGCRVAQRGPVAVSGAYQYGQVDGYQLALAGGGISGNIAQIANALFTGTGLGIGITGNWTAGGPNIRHRIEAKDTYALNGKTVTVSCLVFQNLGSTINYGLQVDRPTTTPDDFSATTLIAATNLLSCQSGVATRISHTFTFGATDASNGIQISFVTPGPTTSAGGTVAISELKLEEGTVVTDYEHVPFEVELARCQRYYCKSYDLATPATTVTSVGSLVTISASTGVAFAMGKFPVSMRVPPTVTAYNAITGTTGTWTDSGGLHHVISVIYTGQAHCSFQCLTVTPSSPIVGHFTATAEL